MDAAGADEREATLAVVERACADVAHVARPQVGVLAEAVRHHRARHLREQVAHVVVVDAQHGEAVEGQPVEEVEEALAQPLVRSG